MPSNENLRGAINKKLYDTWREVNPGALVMLEALVAAGETPEEIEIEMSRRGIDSETASVLRSISEHITEKKGN